MEIKIFLQIFLLMHIQIFSLVFQNILCVYIMLDLTEELVLMSLICPKICVCGYLTFFKLNYFVFEI